MWGDQKTLEVRENIALKTPSAEALKISWRRLREAADKDDRALENAIQNHVDLVGDEPEARKRIFRALGV